DEIAKEGDWTQRSGALGGIVSRMLRVSPEERWSSMQAIVELLENLVVDDSQHGEQRRLATASYSRLQATDRARRLAGPFSRNLFHAAPELEKLFAGTDMKRQYDALNKATKLLLDYDPAAPATEEAIRAVAERHEKYSLGVGHMEAFRAA